MDKLTKHVRTRMSEFVQAPEYNVSDLYAVAQASVCPTTLSLDKIMNTMIKEDFIGKRVDYIPESCIGEFFNIAGIVI